MRIWHYMTDEGEAYFSTEKQARDAHAKSSDALSEPKELNFRNRSVLVWYLNKMLGGA